MEVCEAALLRTAPEDVEAGPARGRHHRVEGAGAGGRPAPRHHGGPGGRGGVPAVQVAHQLLVYRRARPAPEHVQTPAHRALPVPEPGNMGFCKT